MKSKSNLQIDLFLISFLHFLIPKSIPIHLKIVQISYDVHNQLSNFLQFEYHCPLFPGELPKKDKPSMYLSSIIFFTFGARHCVKCSESGLYNILYLGSTFEFGANPCQKPKMSLGVCRDWCSCMYVPVCSLQSRTHDL